MRKSRLYNLHTGLAGEVYYTSPAKESINESLTISTNPEFIVGLESLGNIFNELTESTDIYMETLFTEDDIYLGSEGVFDTLNKWISRNWKSFTKFFRDLWNRIMGNKKKLEIVNKEIKVLETKVEKSGGKEAVIEVRNKVATATNNAAPSSVNSAISSLDKVYTPSEVINSYKKSFTTLGKGNLKLFRPEYKTNSITTKELGELSQAASGIYVSEFTTVEQKVLAKKILEKENLVYKIRDDILIAKKHLKEQQAYLNKNISNVDSTNKYIDTLESYNKQNKLTERFNKANKYANANDAVKSGAYKNENDWFNDMDALYLKGNLKRHDGGYFTDGANIKELLDNHKAVREQYKKAIETNRENIKNIEEVISKGNSFDVLENELNSLAQQLFK